MKNCFLKFHHLGFATKNNEKALLFISSLEYKICKKAYDSIQNVNLIFCKHKSMPNIEIIYPAKTEGPLKSILKNRSELIYHQCYTTTNLARSLDAIKKNGIRIITISKPVNAILFDNRKVSFYYVGGFGLIEILETNYKVKR